LFNSQEALKVASAVAQWISFAQNAALGFHPYILEDGPELPKIPGPHKEEGGEVLEGMYAYSCTSIEESRISGQPGMAGGQVAVSMVRSGPARIVSKDLRTLPT
jgi:hypothetical protein